MGLLSSPPGISLPQKAALGAVNHTVEQKMHRFIILALVMMLGGCVTRPVGRYDAVAAPDVARKELRLSPSVPLADEVLGGRPLMTISLEFSSAAACTGNALHVSLGQWPALGTTFDVVAFTKGDVSIRSEIFRGDVILERRGLDMLRAGDLIFRRIPKPNLN